MDAQLLALRNLTYQLFVGCGRAPTLAEVATEAELTAAETAAGWRELHHQHALVLDLRTAEIRMANPFSAVPTPYRVHAKGVRWYGNCAWDAIGICAALHADGSIETSCPDCGQAIRLKVGGQRVDDKRLLFHCLVPASRWWEDIVFT